MSARLLQRISNRWKRKAEDVEVTQYAGDYVFFRTMEELERQNVKEGTCALQTGLGFWVPKEAFI